MPYDNDPERDEVRSYLSQLDVLKGERATTDSYWQEVADYTLPRRDFTTTRTPGQRRNITIYDSTGMSATEELAAALHGRLTSPYSKWFHYQYAERNVDDESLRYIHDATEAVAAIFNDPETLFASQLHELYLDLVAFGQAVMFVTVRDQRFYFKTLTLADCWIQENDFGIIDTIYYVQKYTPYQAIQAFGKENLHESVVKAYEDNKKIDVKILNVVEPRDAHYGRGAVKNKKPFKSCYVDITNKHKIKEDGYDEFPYLVPRFSKRAGEKYGYGPGMSALSEVKMLNQITEVMIRASNKNVDPPVLSPIEGLVLPMRIDPGGINYYNPDLGEPKFWQSGFRPDYMDFVIRSKQERINKMYYTDWLNIPERTNMTALEYGNRAQESFRNMSGIVARIESELLSRLLSRVLMLAIDNGYIPRPPLTAQGRRLKIHYTSPIAFAQRSIQTDNVLQALNVGATLAQFDQSVPSIYNAKFIARDQAINTYNLPIDYLNSEDVVAEKEAAAAEAQGAAAELQGIESASKSALNLSKAQAVGL